MQQQPKKQAKKDKLSVIRSFISGEDVLPLLLEASNAFAVTFFETHHGIDSDTILVNGKPCTLQEYETILAAEQAKSSFVWVEERDYSQNELKAN